MQTIEKTQTEAQAPATQAQQVPVREKHEAQESGSYEGRWFEPAVDIYETEDALTVVADLPGVAAEDIETDLRDNLLTLTARTRKAQGDWKPLYTEYQEGHYTRTFRLGQHIDQAKISAAFKDGVLTLTLPKAESVKPRKIQVKAE